MKEKNYRKATLLLEDGTELTGFSFGAETAAAGEIVFNTAMTGYPESLTDPSYKGQILVLTYPSVGNYGVPGKAVGHNMHEHFESEHIHVNALIISDYSEKHHHWNASQSLSQWLKEEGVPGLFGIDTRALTRRIREKGAMLAKIVFDTDIPFYNPNLDNLVDKVAVKEKIVYGTGSNKIMLIDCGVKNNIIRYLLQFDTTVIRVPWDYNYLQEDFDGLFISNGPGNPEICRATISHLSQSIQNDQPIFGICLGHQLVSLAAGAQTYKLKYGHRSHNQPVLMEGSNKAYLTSQNHGFAVDAKTLPPDWRVWFTNLNDGSNEGIRHVDKQIRTTQFHPEASSGPTDTAFLFGEFINNVALWKNR